MQTTGKTLNLMMMTAMTIATALLGLPGAPAQAAHIEQDTSAIADAMVASVGDLRTLAALATAADERVAATARRRLRAAGPAGLAAFTTLHAEAIGAAASPAPNSLARFLGLSVGTGPDIARTQVLDTLDELCAQRDCAASRLYWYTDLESATAAARASGKPILSLRLLGDLRDELSCANSRLFRALLYPDPAVAELLGQRFVLHWQSERPAPKITIDFGDGRSIESTITGNSVHYVLDREGRVVDALPGLMTPAAFVAGLERAAGVAATTVDLDRPTRAQALRTHHETRQAELARAWDRELRAIGQAPGRAPRRSLAGAAPRAGDAAPIAITKSGIELPMLGMLGEEVAPLSDTELFDRLAGRHEADVQFSGTTLALLARHQWRSGDASRDASELARATANLRRAVALDTLRNEYDLHRTIHGWFVAGDQDLEALHRRVYDELFLTPRSDPWLGLAAPSIYTGLDGGGRRVQAHL